LVFIFNFNPVKSFTDYGIPVQAGKYKYVLGTDEIRFGGFGLIDETMVYPTQISSADGKSSQLKIYIPARTAIVLQKIPTPNVYQKVKNSVFSRNR
jgi:1,4-alpha-glucan branching enzyme